MRGETTPAVAYLKAKDALDRAKIDLEEAKVNLMDAMDDCGMSEVECRGKTVKLVESRKFRLTDAEIFRAECDKRGYKGAYKMVIKPCEKELYERLNGNGDHAITGGQFYHVRSLRVTEKKKEK